MICIYIQTIITRQGCNIFHATCIIDVVISNDFAQTRDALTFSTSTCNEINNNPTRISGI